MTLSHTRNFILGLYCLFVALSPGWVVSHDASARLLIARQLWQTGSVFIPQQNRPERFFVSPQGLTTYFGMGQSLSFIPFDILGYGLGKLLPQSHPWQGQVQLIPLLFLYAPLLGLLWWWLSKKILRYSGSEEREASLGALFFIISTIALVYVTQSLQEEAAVSVIVAAVFASLLYWTQTRYSILGIWVGFLCGSLLLFRYNTVFAFVPLVGILVDDFSKHKKLPLHFFRLASLGFLFPLLTLLYFNYLRFGSPWETGYSLYYAQLAEKGITTFRAVQPKVALGLLLGPGKGLFVLSPPLLLGLIGIFSDFRKRPFFYTSVLLSLALSVLFHSKLNGYACGGYSWGGRFQVHLIPFLLLPMAQGFRLLKSSWLGKAEIVLLLVLGSLFQGLAVLAPESMEYVQEMARLGDYREELITSPTHGQLPLRVQSFTYWLNGKSLLSNVTLSKLAQASVFQMESHHVPNLWGTSYSSFSGSNPARYLILFLWCLIFWLALGSLATLVIPLPFRKRSGISKNPL